MQTGQILLNGRVWVACATRAVTLPGRMRGLLGRRSLPNGQGLLIERCGSIHTIGMRFAIDVVFLDSAWRVCRVARNVRPGRLCVWGGWKAVRALEVAAGWLDMDNRAEPGAIMEWNPHAG